MEKGNKGKRPSTACITKPSGQNKYAVYETRKHYCLGCSCEGSCKGCKNRCKKPAAFTTGL